MFMMCRISFGILFHSLGAMLEKALSPYVFVNYLNIWGVTWVLPIAYLRQNVMILNTVCNVVYFSNTQVLQC